MKKIISLSLLALILSACSAANTVVDAPARFLGFSIQKFQGEDVGKVEQTVELSMQNAYNKTLDVIVALRGRVTHQSVSRGFIVAFDFAKSFDYCLDSTEVAFFFEAVDANNTKISVISNNSVLAANLGKRFFELMAQK